MCLPPRPCIFQRVLLPLHRHFFHWQRKQPARVIHDLISEGERERGSGDGEGETYKMRAIGEVSGIKGERMGAERGTE